MASRTIGRSCLRSICAAAGVLCATTAVAASAVNSIKLVDPNARRVIPLQLYHPGFDRPLAFVLPGVGAQLGDYSFLSKYLARRGFAVAEVQLELSGDPPMATSGNVAVLRGPELHSGVQTLRYAIGELDRLGYANAKGPVVLVGHSNGGDIAMLYASMYPGRVSVIFSLDNLRVPIPRTSEPHICSLRSDDQKANKGVIPNEAERRRFDIRIQSTKIDHGQMWNGATTAQRRLMVSRLGECLDHPSRNAEAQPPKLR